MKKIIGIILFTVIMLIGCAGLKPLKDENGNRIINSLAEKNFIEIGGMRQGFFLRSENQENPVILFCMGVPEVLNC